MTGTDLIAIERQRQITEEGYGPDHDAGHSEELAQAGQHPGFAWPWGAEYWKPTPDDRIRELVKAGALIAAAIDAGLRASGGTET